LQDLVKEKFKIVHLGGDLPVKPQHKMQKALGTIYAIISWLNLTKN
jgi:hypothetical protein